VSLPIRCGCVGCAVVYVGGQYFHRVAWPNFLFRKRKLGLDLDSFGTRHNVIASIILNSSVNVNYIINNSRLKYSYDPLGLLGYRKFVISDKEYKKYDAGTTQFEFNLDLLSLLTLLFINSRRPKKFVKGHIYEAQGIIKIDRSEILKLCMSTIYLPNQHPKWKVRHNIVAWRRGSSFL